MQYKTKIVPVKASKKDIDYLMQLNALSAQVWNIIIDINEKHRAENEGKWISQNELQTLTKKCVPLHAKGIQHIVHKYIFARDSAVKAKEAGEFNKYPHRKKKFMVTGWDGQSVKLSNKYLLLPRPLITDENGKNRKQKPVKCYVKELPDKVAEVELLYRNGLKLAIKYKENADNLQIVSENHSSIDLGEIHSITSVDSRGNAIIITGRLMRSFKQHRNKQQAKIYRRMSKCKRDSRQYKKYLKALSNLKQRYDNKNKDIIHKTSKLYLDFCIENNISTVYYGDLDSATRHTKNNNRGNNNTRQKLSQWSHGQLTLQLKIKGERYGINLIKVKEYYTSQKCPACQSLNKPKGREYKCKCGYSQHRDIVGSINILNDNTESKLTRYTNKKYLRIAYKAKVVNADVGSLSNVS